MVGGVWRLSIDRLNEHKTAGHENGQCFGDYHQIFGHVWKVTEHPVISGQDRRTDTSSLFNDVASCDFFLFYKILGIIKGIHFKGIEAIKRAITINLRSIPEKFFQQYIEAWQRNIGKCIRLEGGLLSREKSCWFFGIEMILSVTLVPLLFRHTLYIFKIIHVCVCVCVCVCGVIHYVSM